MSALPPQSLESALSPSNSQDPQQRNRPTVREIEIRRPNPSPLPPAARRVVSTLGQLVQVDDHDDGSTSVSSSDGEEILSKHLERDRSLTRSRSRSRHESPRLSPSRATLLPTVQPTNPQQSPGLAQFNFGLPHPLTANRPDSPRALPSEVTPWGQGAVQGSRHFV